MPGRIANVRKFIRLLTLVAAAAGVGFFAARAAEPHAEKQSGARSKVALEQKLDLMIDGQPAKATLLELEYPPGGDSGAHRHPGPVVVYVLSGAIESAIDDEPPKTYRAGDSFFEPAGVLHAVSRNASRTEPARFLAFMLSPADAKRLVTPPE